MSILEALLRPTRVVHAHCDLPCGIYDPAQAKIEAESVKAIQTRYQDPEKFKTKAETVDDYRARCLIIKEGLAKKSQDPQQGQGLLDAIAEIDKIFWETKKAA